MRCKACGNVIPSEYLQQDNFSCPSCGKTYRRNTKSDGAASEGGRSRDPDRKRPSGSKKQAGSSEMLLRVMACAVVVALIISIVALVAGMRSKSFAVCGQAKGITVEGKTYVEVPIEIPAQPNENYLVACDINSTVVNVGIVKKTATSFSLGFYNIDNKVRTVSVNWALVPCQLPNGK